MTETIPAAFGDAVRRDPAAPLLTYYDDVSGDRTELSGATLDNWVQKTANLLVDGAGLGPGDNVALVLPPHWQTAAVLLGTLTAGLAADLGPEPQPVEAVFTALDRVEAAATWPSTERYVTGLLPFALGLHTPPAGHVDYPTEVRVHGDHFRPGQPVLPDDRALAGPTEMSHRTVIGEAARRAKTLGIGAGDRVLIDARLHPDVPDWLFAPLVAGASIVLCVNLDPVALAHRAEAEKVSQILA